MDCIQELDLHLAVRVFKRTLDNGKRIIMLLLQRFDELHAGDTVRAVIGHVGACFTGGLYQPFLHIELDSGYICVCGLCQITDF